MLKTEFAKRVSELLEVKEDVSSVQISEVTKNNGVVMTGLTISTEGVNIAPTFYIEPFYADYAVANTTISDTAEEIYKQYKKYRIGSSLNTEFILEFGSCNNMIYPKLINAEANKELLANCPHYIVEDLAEVFYLTLISGSILIKNDLFEKWDIQRKNLKFIAEYNLSKINPKLTKVNEMINMPVDSPIYAILSDIPFGANVILNDSYMQELIKKFGDLIILPSSIHEVIIIPKKDIDIDLDYLKNMIKEVNNTVLNPIEVLSYSVYEYTENGLKSLI